MTTPIAIVPFVLRPLLLLLLPWLLDGDSEGVEKDLRVEEVDLEKSL